MGANIHTYRRNLLLALGCVASTAVGIYYGVRVGRAFWPLTGKAAGIIFTVVLLLCLFMQLIANIIGVKKYSRFYQICIWISGIGISLLIYGMGLMVVLDIVTAILTHVAPIEISYHLCARISLIGSALLTVYGLIHAAKVKAVHYTLKTEKFQGNYRIVQLSDLHIGCVVGARQMKRARKIVNALKPDLVVITGDLMNHSTTEECGNLDAAEKELAGMQAPDGVFAVTGNHDPLPHDTDFCDFLQKSKIRLLDNQWAELGKVDLFGRSGNYLQGRKLPKKIAAEEGQNRFLVFLDHYPDGWKDAQAAGADLFLAGHTHGGQYFPCNLLLKKLYKKGLVHGHTVRGKTDCIISAGTGYFQIPIRIGTNSEVVCIDVEGSI